MARPDQAFRGQGCRERLQIRLAREPRIERFEPLGRLRQQGGSVAATRRREGDLRAQQLGAGSLELVQRAGLRDRQQPQRRVVRAGLVLALCGEERALGAAPGIGGQLGGPFVKCGAGCQAASRPRSPGRALQLGGDVLVEPGRRVRKVPGAAIRIDIGIGGLRECTVDVLALLRCRPAVHRRAHERVSEPHLRAEIDQSSVGRRHGRVRPRAELGRRPPHQHRIPHRLGRSGEKQQPRRRRQRRQPLREALSDPPRQRRGIRQPEPARKLGRRAATWQLEQRQRVAARLGHDPITHPLIERTGDHGRE
jgi:hypothetical protein